jgi:hypothetical protein
MKDPGGTRVQQIVKLAFCTEPAARNEGRDRLMKAKGTAIPIKASGFFRPAISWAEGKLVAIAASLVGPSQAARPDSELRGGAG